MSVFSTRVKNSSFQGQPHWPVFRARVVEHLADFSPAQGHTPPDGAGAERMVFDLFQAERSSLPGNATNAAVALGWPLHPFASRELLLRKAAVLPASIDMAILDAELRLLYLDGQLINVR
ncbi:MAG TPA: hypothetical protein VNK45_01055 [Candidatus Acidoferrales bacterium]|nr:hypothetical protein [Candidatus Acidoferrales bacterium]